MNTEQALRQATIKIAELSAENAKLRNVIARRDKHARRVEQAYKDALQLALWAVAGVPPSRAYAESHGMSQQRWNNATALLRQARVLIGHRRWSTKDAGLIELKLDRVRLVATESKDAYKARHVRDRRR